MPQIVPRGTILGSSRQRKLFYVEHFRWLTLTRDFVPRGTFLKASVQAQIVPRGTFFFVPIWEMEEMIAQQLEVL